MIRLSQWNYHISILYSILISHYDTAATFFVVVANERLIVVALVAALVRNMARNIFFALTVIYDESTTKSKFTTVLNLVEWMPELSSY